MNQIMITPFRILVLASVVLQSMAYLPMPSQTIRKSTLLRVFNPVSTNSESSQVARGAGNGIKIKAIGHTSNHVPTDTSSIASPNNVHRHAQDRKPWGVDNTHPSEYWFDDRIHTLGNVGFLGALHAAIAPISTKLIDHLAYEGVDIRQQVAEELYGIVGKTKARVLDLCCGVGISTRALSNAFHDAETVMGLDTSAEMVAMADFLTRHLGVVKPFMSRVVATKLSTGYSVIKEQGNKIKKAAQSRFPRVGARFAQANAENTHLPDQSFDLVTVMYAFHEAPEQGRERILEEARRLLQPDGMLAIVDISTEYTPSETMIKGEPYVVEYQLNINRQLESLKGFASAEYKTLVAGHVGMWVLKRAPYAIA